MEDGHLLPLLAEGNHNFFSRGSVLEISCPLSEFLKMGSCGMNLCEMDPELWERETDLGDEAYRRVIKLRLSPLSLEM